MITDQAGEKSKLKPKLLIDYPIDSLRRRQLLVLGGTA
jgi:hypothetical protein